MIKKQKNDGDLPSFFCSLMRAFYAWESIRVLRRVRGLASLPSSL